MTKVKLSQLVKPFFEEWLVNNDFLKTEEILDEKTFGNELVKFTSPNCLIRFVRDRGDL